MDSPSPGAGPSGGAAVPVAAVHPWGWHLRRTLALAWPFILSRVGILMMTTLDVVVVGRAGAQELAYYVLGYSIVDSLIAVMAGLQLGVAVLTARAVGAGQGQVAATIWRRGLVFAVLLGLGAALLVQPVGLFYALVGQEPALAAGGGAVTALLGFAMPFFGIFLVSTMFLEAIEKPFHATVAVFLANGLNLGLSILLVFGAGPIPALGAWGCALATVFTSAVLGLGLAAYVRFRLPGRQAWGMGLPAPAMVPPAREQRALGLAAGASYGLEAASFAALTLIAGLLGAIGLAAMGVLFQLFALAFMTSFGIASATQVRVGNAWGRGSAGDMARAGFAGLVLSAVVSSSISIAFVVAPGRFIGLLTTDAAVIAAALPVMGWMVLALVCDGGQTVMNHACRGRGDTWVPTTFHLVSYWFVMVPLAYLLALDRNGGASGLYQAIFISSIVSLLAMGSRFTLLSRRGLPAGGRPAEGAAG